MQNKKIRILLKVNEIPFWKVADAIGISEPTMTRWMRKPLSEDHYRKIMHAINELSGGEVVDEIN